MITNLHVLRGLAALSVVIYHTDYRPFGGSHTDFFGVAIFFVLSGFLMTYVSRDSADGFMTARITRIVPLYWVMTLFAAVWFAAGLNNVNYVWPMFFEATYKDPATIFNHLRVTLSQNLELGHILQSLLFVPAERMPIIGVGWTLNIEMFFYLVFWLCLLVSRHLAPALVCGVFYGLAHHTNSCGSVCALYGHDYVMFFVAGIVCYYLWCGVHMLPRLAFYVLVPAAIGVLIAWPLICLYGPPSHTIHRWLPPSVVFATLVLHSAGFRSGSRPLFWLGSASYALYLSHPLVVNVFNEAAKTHAFLSPPNTLSGFLAAVSVSVGIAVLIHFAVEAPMLRWLRGRPLADQAPRTALP